MDTHRIRVLLVDDDDSLRLSAEHMLISTGGFDVVACPNGQAALETLMAGGIDVMVLDHKMPGISGLNVLQWLHERKQLVPTLMLTGEGSEHIAVEALKMGAFDYIRKDHLDLRRLPVVVRGLYERKLFREERSRREADRIRSAERSSIERSLQEAIQFLEESVGEAYLEVIQLVQEAELASQERTPDEAGSKRDIAFRKLKASLQRMHSDIRSLLDQSYLLLSDRSLKNMPHVSDDAVPSLEAQSDRKQ